MNIRREETRDTAAIDEVNRAAFETPSEANLVRALREQATPVVSLVAADGDSVVGHIMFSPVTLSSHPDARIMGLAPMAVAPSRQRQGIGSALVRAGLEECRRLGFIAVVLVGHAEFYPRFGFVPGSRFALGCEYDVPDDVFMALRLDEGTRPTGLVRYHPAFGRAG